MWVIHTGCRTLLVELLRHCRNVQGCRGVCQKTAGAPHRMGLNQHIPMKHFMADKSHETFQQHWKISWGLHSCAQPSLGPCTLCCREGKASEAQDCFVAIKARTAHEHYKLSEYMKILIVLYFLNHLISMSQPGRSTKLCSDCCPC